MASVQYVVISACERRKALLEREFAELQCTIPIHYLEATTPSNAADYLPPDCTEKQKRNLCCTRSHIRALAYAGRDESPEFTVILEDDVALHKTAFQAAVFELIAKWDTMIRPHSSMVSLGWIPCRPFEAYSRNASIGSLDCVSDSKISLIFAPGLQAYLIPKAVAKECSAILDQPTTALVKDAIQQSIRDKRFTFLTPDVDDKTSDMFFNRMMSQCVIIPPLAIEQPVASMLEHHNEQVYWNNFFKGAEHLRETYWSASTF